MWSYVDGFTDYKRWLYTDHRFFSCSSQKSVTVGTSSLADQVSKPNILELPLPF